MSAAADWTALIDRPGLDPAVRGLALAHGATCVGRFADAEALYRLARDRGASAKRCGEMALQVVAYAGFPRAIEGLGVVARVCGGPDATLRPGAENGRAVFDAVYADAADAVLAGLDRGAAGFSRWVLEDAYGHVLSRPGLTLAERELAAVAALGPMGLARPLESHVRGALRNGSTREDVEDILRASRRLADDDAAAVIDAAIRRLPRTS